MKADRAYHFYYLVSTPFGRQERMSSISQQISEILSSTHEWTLSVRPYVSLAAPSALKCALGEYGISGWSRSDDFALSSWTFENFILSKMELAFLHQYRLFFPGLPLGPGLPRLFEKWGLSDNDFRKGWTGHSSRAFPVPVDSWQSDELIGKPANGATKGPTDWGLEILCLTHASRSVRP